MRLIRELTDIIYPPRCVACGEFLWKAPLIRGDNGPLFCPACMARLHPVSSPLCPICGIPFDTYTGDDHPCEDCLRKRPWYDSAVAPFLYQGPVLEAVHRLKYRLDGFVADSLGPMLSRFTRQWIRGHGGLLIMPVPLHPKRVRERGFNQSLLLARHVAGELRAELDFLSLRRVKYTLPQTRLSKEERKKNVRGAFQLKNPRAVRGKTVLLIDDVITTGNTLNQCARVLKRGGAEKVSCVALARAV
ncbi:MAG: ComF family protein [Deltaproteobacteria bacterium]|nr:ComF family protein [Deltaproteobacteria bacterium]MBW2050057.1 ComF family protein [Deltaproteobacteria bacterium]MBW2112466.1 ComF family protein [Deltaproteobacteria bacterium]MBW2354845.1 ComF family protein [Deltaproteobacteria bacterium]